MARKTAKIGGPKVDPLPDKREAYLNIRLPADMHDELVEIAERNEVTVSHVVRSALRQWLAGEVSEE